MRPPPGTGSRPGIVFSVAGVPHSARGSGSLAGVERVAELGLGGMEVEFVHGVRMGEALADRVGERARQLGVVLTCHGPYYINLNSDDADKRRASAERILATARAARRLGARSITFHAGFYMGQDPAAVYRTVKEALARIVDTLRAEGNGVQIRPELTGKPSQFGSLDELLALGRELDGVLPCIDFSHLYARTAGGYNSPAAFREVLERYADALGPDSLADLHLHVSGIEYTPKGERRHQTLAESRFNYRELLRAVKAARAGGVVVCESPIQEDDALTLKRSYARLRVPHPLPPQPA